MRPEQDVKLFSPLCLNAEGNAFQPKTYELPDGTTLLLAPNACVRGSVAPAGLAGKSLCSSQEETFELPESARYYCLSQTLPLRASVVPAKFHQQRSFFFVDVDFQCPFVLFFEES